MFVEVQIEKQHVIDYALGKTGLDPIELALGCPDRYEVLNDFIYDHKLRCNLPQSESFKEFSSRLNEIRRAFANLKGYVPIGGRGDGIINVCNELFAIAPTKIFIR